MLAEPGLAPFGPLDGYCAANAVGDLYLTAPPPIAGKWRTVAGSLAALGDSSDGGGDRRGDGGGGLRTAQDLVARQVADLGLTFRITGDQEERAWPLTAMPLIVGGAEWAGIERGLIQRARLLEAVAADIAGDQALVAGGHLPPAVIAGSRYFARKMLGVRPASGHFLHVYAADLARGPDGQWRILADRVRLANGIGYALENRMAMSRLIDDTLSAVNARRLADFFATLRDGIAADCRRERPRVALLTPGRFNQSYSEQAHLARYLGLPLVEGRDLVVTGGRLYVRTIAGPKRIDAAWRWIDTTALDPLNFDARSRIGVAGLFGAWRSGDLEMANWPGTEVLESKAFAAFLPRLSHVLLGEPLALPNVATWWCGQPAEAATVRERLDALLIAPAFGQAVAALDRDEGVPGRELAPAPRAALLEAMRRRPMDYCGQEIVALSTAPALVEGALTPRPFTIRAFVARTPDGGWAVMPGGFARLSTGEGAPTALMGAGEISADVCIVDAVSMPGVRPTVLSRPPTIRRGSGILASQAADNLFWFARYTERAETTVRVVRSILGSAIEVDGGHARAPDVRGGLVRLLQQWNAISQATARAGAQRACAAALTEADLGGGVAALVGQARQVALSLRERFGRDVWRIVDRPLPGIDTSRPQAMLEATNALVDRFSALAGLTSENMVRSHAWRFLDLGRRLERGVALCRIVRQLAALPERADALGVVLDLADSQIAYRSRYLTGPVRNPVLDLVLLDPDNPRSLAFQVQRLHDHVAALPALTDDNLPEAPLLAARGALAPLATTPADRFGEAELRDVETRLLALSDAISTRYFLQIDRPDNQDALLG